MRNKLKKTLVSLLAAGTIGLGTIGGLPAKTPTFRPYGYFELAYVPERTLFKKYRNESMVKLGLGLRVGLKKFDFTVNAEQTTYSSYTSSILFNNPNTQVYDYSVELKRKFRSSSISLFFSRECVHPVDNKPFWVYDYERNKSFYINSTDVTKVGLRFEFGVK